MTQASVGSTGSRGGPVGQVVVLIPTFNERENLPQIVARMRTAVPEADVLVLDDNSPDGTGAVADDLARDDRQVRVLHRPGKEGLGAAYLAGFEWALAHGYDVLVELDADGSHPPDRLPAMLEALRDADVVIGSRWIPGGSVVNWPRHRELLSRGSNLYTRILLGMPVHDATAGFRAYRASALRTLGLGDDTAQGYFFQVDLTWRAVRAGLRIVEVPITFVEREVGASKMSQDIIKDSAVRVTRRGVRYRLEQLKGLPRVARREPTWHQLED
ncbi:polyprenol monophosphomannose synthase [Segeticoccus rhizosphaerae]|uniref:polyprenol monophosphomannose synthase n=1 Tax=Segeticoccus rhizosphaerae TaxID=1104777 RepID=UPI001264A7E8|nr:polyprenol monophosphomannose synthase [Segeticoccus rhizosphaerae]